jgi:hypothetical protein
MANEVFCSYARADKEIIRQLFDALLEQGIDLWLDVEDIRGATVWMDSLLTAIQNCQNFLYCISEHSIQSPYCQAELAHALRLNKRIIPILVAETNPDFCPQAIRELQWIFLNKDFKIAIDELIGVIEAPEGVSWGDRLDSKLEIMARGRPTRILGLYRKCYLAGRSPETNVSDAGIIIVEERTGARKPMISRTHFRLSFKVGRWHIEDLSRNGTTVNGKPLRTGENRVLKHKDVIRIPGNHLIYQEIHTLEAQTEADPRETGV